jgi:hypothetical protein
MIYRAKPGQVSSGEAIGILLLDTSVPFIPGDVANATTYSFPVRYQKVQGFTVARALRKDPAVFDSLLEAARDLCSQGVRAITGDCGFMAVHQKKMAAELDVPVFLSSLLQLPFILNVIGPRAKVGVITADSHSLDESLLNEIGVGSVPRLVVRGLEDQKHFYEFGIAETGVLDAASVETEVVTTARQMIAAHPEMRAVLLECSLLPPYAVAVQEALGLPVFDYITMINYVFSAVVKRRFEGFV